MNEVPQSKNAASTELPPSEGTAAATPPSPPPSSGPPRTSPPEPTSWQQKPVREGRRKVLIVEDEALIALDLERRVTRMGFEVVGTADNRDEAVELFRESKPDLVLMDIFIRGPVDGVETARSIGLIGDVPVIFLTAFADSDTVGRAAAVSPYGYLLKPFDDNTLAATVRVALERHGADTQLRLLRAAVESAQIGIELTSVVESARDVVFVNAAFAELMGLARASWVGKPSWLLGRDGGGEDLKRLQDALRNCNHGDGTIEFRGPGNETRYASVTVSPVLDRTGRVTHLLSHFVDITRQRATEMALEVSQRMELMGRLTANIAHDFNNVLGAIVAFGELARDGVTDPDARQDIEEVLGAARRGAALTRKLLDFTRSSDADRLVAADVVEVVRKLLSMLERICGPRIHVELVLPKAPIVAAIDGHSLEQVLLNLVTNARDAMPQGGRLTVSIELAAAASTRVGAGQAVRISLKDTGIGMDDSVRRRIFEPLFTTKPSGKGTGLGLAICQMLVERSNGTIDVVSAPGEGSTFTLELPLSSADVELPAPAEPTPARSGDARGALVLLVDDEATLRRACARALGEVGFQVVEAPDGESAVRELDARGSEFRLVISDLMLPGLSGEQVLVHARKVASQARTLMISGYVDRPRDSFAADQMVLWKPFTTSALIRHALEAIQPGPAA